MRPDHWRSCALAAASLATAVLTAAAPVPAAPADGPAHDGEHVLVGFAPTTTGAERATAHAAEGARVVNRFERFSLDVVELPDGADPVVWSARYERRAGVAYAHPNWEMALLATPNDAQFSDLWGLHNTGQPVTGSFVRGVADVDIDAPEAWDVAYGTTFPSGGGTRVGILDTGIDPTHLDLQGKTKACASALSATGVVVTGSCTDDNLHGTHVAGTVAAIADNGVGVAGVAPDAELAIFKALNSAGVGFYADIVAGVEWLSTTGNAPIISMSIGGPEDKALNRALTDAASRGTLLIAAAGNDGDETPNWPAAHADVMSVSAVDAAGKRASFSTCNEDVEIAAPGVDIWSTAPGNTYVAIDGTSMATPHVSGAAALLMSEKGTDASQTRSALRNSTERSGNCNGVGLLNLALALGGSSSGGGGDDGSTDPVTSDPGAITGTVTVHRSGAAIPGATVDCGSAGSATTAGDGGYTISDVTAGSYSCTASATGYRSRSSSVTVSSGQTTTANFVLRPKR
ncbi:MAG: S8 family serine peptidase [Actinobacteria bacterium]|nr:S8 family serine peptidase [Actinomycetota bacterium]